MSHHSQLIAIVGNDVFWLSGRHRAAWILPVTRRRLFGDCKDPTDPTRVYPSPIYKTSERKVGAVFCHAVSLHVLVEGFLESELPFRCILLGPPASLGSCLSSFMYHVDRKVAPDASQIVTLRREFSAQLVTPPISSAPSKSRSCDAYCLGACSRLY